MKGLELSTTDLVETAKVIVDLSDLYDNEETAKGCYDCHDIFKRLIQEMYIKSDISSEVRTFLSHVSRNLRDARITEIIEMHANEEDEDEE